MATPMFRHPTVPLTVTDPKPMREHGGAVDAREYHEHYALLCHRYRHGPHLVGMAAGPLDHHCEACRCACTEAAQGGPPRVAEFTLSNEHEARLDGTCPI